MSVSGGDICKGALSGFNAWKVCLSDVHWPQVVVSDHLSGAFTVTGRWTLHFLPISKPFGKQLDLTLSFCVYMCVCTL